MDTHSPWTLDEYSEDKENLMQHQPKPLGWQIMVYLSQEKVPSQPKKEKASKQNFKKHFGSMLNCWSIYFYDTKV